MPRHFGWESFGFGFGPRGFFWAGPRRRRRHGGHEPRRGSVGEGGVPGELAVARRGHAQADRRPAGEGAGGDRNAGDVTRPHAGAVRRCRSSCSAAFTYTRVICFRHDRSKSVLSSGLAGRYAASAAAAIASPERSVPVSTLPASTISCGRLATPPRTIDPDSTVRSSHLIHAATPSTGKSNEPRRRNL